jgi:hypothetical protein
VDPRAVLDGCGKSRRHRDSITGPPSSYQVPIPTELFRPAVSIIEINTGCPTSYRTRHFFNNFTTNEDIPTKFEADLRHCVRNVKEKNVLLFKFRCNIFIGVGIINEMPGSVASGTLCIIIEHCVLETGDIL